MSDIETPFRQAVAFLGGQVKTAEAVGRAQSRISNYLASNKPPADVCMRIETLTKGKFPASTLRPDLAKVFEDFRTAEGPSA
jgi:DNA-binding transcriptional regulator YdaS (Cro superfamily)